jgi:hypothetical protein
MPVSLAKIVAGNPMVSDSLPNEQTVKCPLRMVGVVVFAELVPDGAAG